MNKLIALAAAAALSLSACGGGGSSSTPPQTTAQVFKLSFYGQPTKAATGATAHAAAVAHAASDSSAASDAAATVTSLQDALTAQGVPATVTAQVMDGTTLHALIMGEDNGLPPTADQFGADPSGWLIANFQLDDMASRVDVPAQAAAITQFESDLTIFIQRAHVAGKQTFIVLPVQTCDEPIGFSASDGLFGAESRAAANAGAILTGALPFVGITVNGAVVNQTTDGHLGTDCRTPDAYLQNLRTTATATDIATRLKLPS